jgi:hypothetical protein
MPITESITKTKRKGNADYSQWECYDISCQAQTQIEMIQWAFPVELIEFELLIDPPMVEVTDYDYTEFYEIFLQRAIDYLEDPANKNEWICPSEDHWLTMFTRLNNFHRTHKHLDILAEVDGTPDLFVWLEYQKDPDTDLSREKRHSLRSLGVRLPPIRRN